MQISKAMLERMQRQARSAAARASKMKEKAEELTQKVMDGATISGTAFLISYSNHRFRGSDGKPGIEILGVPIDLGIGIGGHLMGLFMGGQYANAMHNVGNGALASYLTTMGSGLGTKHWQERSGSAQLPAETEVPASGRVNRITDEEIRRIAQRL